MASDLPNITLTGEDGAEVPKRTVKFQCGLLRETETFVGEDVDILCRETLLDYICDMLALKVSEWEMERRKERGRERRGEGKGERQTIRFTGTIFHFGHIRGQLFRSMLVTF